MRVSLTKKLKMREQPSYILKTNISQSTMSANIWSLTPRMPLMRMCCLNLLILGLEINIFFNKNICQMF